jgi:hypothetical protein
MEVRPVKIIVTENIVGTYEARSYPDEQKDSSGYYNLYSVPVYSILVEGLDNHGKSKTINFMAPRFMPYFNDPKKPHREYSTKGWVNAGLSGGRTITVLRYIETYQVRNRYSPGYGAIVLVKTFYIHAGPSSLSDYGFGSAGCIEIIGNYEEFKQAIAQISGISGLSSNNAIQKLVNERKLVVVIKQARVPDTRKISRKVRD